MCFVSLCIESITHFDPLYGLSRHENEVTAIFYVHTDKVMYCSDFFII